METADMKLFIQQLLSELRSKSALNVDQYEQKLKDNTKNIDHLNDLLLEGRAALMFINNKFMVTFGESPDLKIEIGDEIVGVEVKHFRVKHQDQIDEKAMEDQARKYQETGDEEDDLFVPIGDTTATEGTPTWQQMANVAASKAKQYLKDAPNILIIESSSESTSLTLSTAAHEFEDIVHERCDPRLRRLNALMMVNCSLYGFGNSGPYNIEFCQLVTSTNPMSNKLVEALSNIRLG
ncbi:MAG: hypothetical protein PHO26_04160 [Dehalococcoidia bacterium]|nr:hypothetical protein [Dehalococcoidia bacterium]MDD5493183.1 hypothetical protein [Dehalococcoidia bacterium]